MNAYFFKMNQAERNDILDQHKSLYNGYQTMQPQYSNTQPLTVYDFAGDKDGMVVNNKGEVKKYTNMGINEQVEEQEKTCPPSHLFSTVQKHTNKYDAARSFQM